MRLAGVLPEDAPDPRDKLAEQLQLMPIPMLGLAPQPSLEDADGVAFTSSQDDHGYSMMAASITYTLWRNPHDRSDPSNLAELDERTRQALDEVPPWPRPEWLVEQVKRLRYPQLWEAARTTWHREPSERSTVSRVLAGHVRYNLVNQYRQELGLSEDPAEQIPSEDPSPVVTGTTSLLINGVEVAGVEVDADPLVYGIGAELPSGGVVTAVLPRAELKYLQLHFTTQN
ncbi:hypothetical protein LG293_14810 [Citricoccus nitrophenolicus]